MLPALLPPALCVPQLSLAWMSEKEVVMSLTTMSIVAAPAVVDPVAVVFVALVALRAPVVVVVLVEADAQCLHHVDAAFLVGWCLFVGSDPTGVW